MNLIDDFKAPCVLLELRRIPDGEGGFYSEWIEGAEFKAAVTLDSTLEARIAEKEGVASIYTVTTEKNAMLRFHDVFRRKTDGKLFRVTSDGEDIVTPARASFHFSQVTAEEWRLPT